MDREFHRFNVPVHIFTRLPFAQLIWTVPQALAFLSICRKRHHTAEFYIALGACRAAIQREAPAGWAREAFRQFAEHGAMLMDEDDTEAVDVNALFLDDERLAA